MYAYIINDINNIFCRCRWCWWMQCWGHLW